MLETAQRIMAGLISAENVLMLISTAIIGVIIIAVVKSYIHPYVQERDDPVYDRVAVQSVSRLIAGDGSDVEKMKNEERKRMVASAQYGICTTASTEDAATADESQLSSPSVLATPAEPRSLLVLRKGAQELLEAFTSRPIDTLTSKDLDIADVTNLTNKLWDDVRWDNSTLVETRSRRFSNNRPYKMILCHDMRGNYLNDVDVRGDSFNNNAFQVTNWEFVDTFCYFSHHLLTIPPAIWINNCRRHGKTCIGTFITEWENGAGVCEKMFATKARAVSAAHYLARLCRGFGFDGWLINIENKLSLNAVANVLEFLKTLRHLLKELDSDNLLIWYDSVTKDGELQWQDKLSDKNSCFFDLCDGIFINYTWRPKNIADSIDLLKSSRYLKDSKLHVEGNSFSNISRRFDLYFGCDIFGRGTNKNLTDASPPSTSPSSSSEEDGENLTSGGFESFRSVLKAAEAGVSVALFAPGWVLECQMPDISPKPGLVGIEGKGENDSNEAKAKESQSGSSNSGSVNSQNKSFQDYSMELISAYSNLFEGVDAVWRNYSFITNAETFREIYYSNKRADSMGAIEGANSMLSLPLSVSFSQGMGKYIFVNGRKHLHPQVQDIASSSLPSSLLELSASQVREGTVKSSRQQLAPKHSLDVEDVCAYYDLNLQDTIVPSSVLHNIFKDIFSYRNNSINAGVPKPIKISGSGSSSNNNIENDGDSSPSSTEDSSVLMFSCVCTELCFEHALEGSSSLSMNGLVKYSWRCPIISSGSQSDSLAADSSSAYMNNGASTVIVVPILRMSAISNHYSRSSGISGGPFDLNKFLRSPLKMNGSSGSSCIKHLATLGTKIQAVFIRIAIGFRDRNDSDSTSAVSSQSCVSVKLTFSSQGHVNAARNNNNTSKAPDHFEIFKDTIVLSDPNLVNEFARGEKLRPNKSIYVFPPYHVEKLDAEEANKYNLDSARSVDKNNYNSNSNSREPSVTWDVREYRLPPTALVDLISRDLTSVDLLCQTIATSSDNSNSNSNGNSSGNSSSNVRSDSNTGGVESVMHKFGAFVGFISINTEMASNLNINDKNYTKSDADKDREKIMEKFEGDRDRYTQKTSKNVVETSELHSETSERKLSSSTDNSPSSHLGALDLALIPSRSKLGTITYSPEVKKFLVYFDVNACITSHLQLMKGSLASGIIFSGKPQHGLSANKSLLNNRYNNNKSSSSSSSSSNSNSSIINDVFYDLSKVRSKAIYVCALMKHHRKLLSLRYPHQKPSMLRGGMGGFYYFKEDEEDRSTDINSESRSDDGETDNDELLSVTRCNAAILTIHEKYSFPLHYHHSPSTPASGSYSLPQEQKVDAFLLKIVVQRCDFSYWEDRLHEHFERASRDVKGKSRDKDRDRKASLVLPIYVVVPVQSLNG